MNQCRRGDADRAVGMAQQTRRALEDLEQRAPWQRALADERRDAMQRVGHHDLVEIHQAL